MVTDRVFSESYLTSSSQQAASYLTCAHKGDSQKTQNCTDEFNSQNIRSYQSFLNNNLFCGIGL